MDGTKLAFTTLKPGDRHIYQMDMASGQLKTFSPLPLGQYVTPAYAPDGQTLAFGVLGSKSDGIYSYNVVRDCCLKRVTGGSWKDLSPTYSPDGRQMAFTTDRFGTSVPQVMIMPAGGGDAQTLSPLAYGTGGAYAAPDWSPTGDLVAFHGQINGGNFQILVADLKNGGRRLRQLTWEGDNEDPTWAPDGRHLAFWGERNWGFGLFVVDVATGRIRVVLSGRKVGVPDWSPALGPS
jgi:TolB protein